MKGFFIAFQNLLGNLVFFMECMHHAMFYGRFLKQGIAKSKWISLPMPIKKNFKISVPEKQKQNWMHFWQRNYQRVMTHCAKIYALTWKYLILKLPGALGLKLFKNRLLRLLLSMTRGRAKKQRLRLAKVQWVEKSIVSYNTDFLKDFCTDA